MTATIDDRVAELERANAELQRQLAARTTELEEAREQQTAAAEVLQVIKSSPGDLAPVFEAMLEKAIRLCDAAFGILLVRDGSNFRTAALHGVPPAMAEFLSRTPREPGKHTAVARMLDGEDVVQFEDMAKETAYLTGDSRQRAFVELGGTRTYIAVALRKDGKLVGTIGAYRQEVRPFSDKQIALLQNFAGQAGIAMENARLLTETRQALEQQTATAEVLQAINSSPGDLAPVFDAILERAMRLCEVVFGVFTIRDGERFRNVAWRGVPAALADFLREPMTPGGGTLGRLLRGEIFAHVPDITAEEVYRTSSPGRRALAELGGARSALAVPLRKDTALLGAFLVYRQEVRPFTDKQIALLQNFATQAVIAMENARLITETREALEQQTATAEVLQVINSSPGDLAPVFDAMLEKAMHLCEAAFGTLWTYDGVCVHAVALHNVPAVFAEFLTRAPHQVGPDSAHGRLLRGEPVVHIPDIVEEQAYRLGDPIRRALVELGGGRTLLAVPLRKDHAFLGDFVIYRQEARAFTDKQIALLQNFAAQAVIAMENARLLTETREALEQQTATAEVLQVINSSPGDLAPVFDTILEKAHALCGASHGALVTYDGEHFRAVATHELPALFADLLRQPFRPEPASPQAQLLRGERLVHMPDASAMHGPGWDGPRTPAAREAGLRALLMVPLRKDSRLLGYITANRGEPGPFTEKQIALLQNFAAQAVIAMENARLITETREALEQQTATAEVLGVINSSPGDLAPVFDAMLERAMRLCEAAFGTLWTYDGDRFRSVAQRGVPGPYAEYLAHNAPAASAGTGRSRILRGERFVHVADLKDEEPYRAGDPHRRAMVDLGGARTGLIVPLRKDDAVIGFVMIYRQQVRPFSDKQIALLQNFAAQAVIAMENARLITETREALEQQTATAEVLGVINSSPGDVQPTFDAIAASATRLCEAASGAVFRFDGSQSHLVAHYNCSPAELDALLGVYPHAPSRGSVTGRAILTRAVAYVADIATDPEYALPSIVQSGMHAHLSVPMLLDGNPVGAITVARREAKPFSDTQIELLKTFAAQAVIAMENARLLTETREALEQQTATAEVLQVINSSPGDLAPVFDAMLDRASLLCGAAFGCLWTYDGERMHAAALRGAPPDFAEFLTRAPHPVGPDNAHGRLLRGDPLVHISDVADDEAYRAGDPVRRHLVELGGGRTLLAVPLRKDEQFLGDFVMYRTEVRLFSDKQIALLQNFAAQAVIAMENARLITELRESLEYQTATSDVLKVISRSVFDLETVLQTVVVTAIRLCRADSAVIYRNEDGEYRWAVGHMLSPEYEEIERSVRIRPGTGTVVGRAALEGRVVQILDAWTDPLYEAKDDARVGGVHTMIGVPLMRDSVPIGVIGLARRRVESFSEREIQLVTTFADQAVIAIENARLFEELRQRTHDLQESLEYQTASGDVLKVISQSGGELEPVLDTLVKTAARLCDAEMAFIHRREGEVYRPAAVLGFPVEFTAYLEAHPIVPGRGSITGRVALEGRAIHIADVATDREYELSQAIMIAKQRTSLGVPLLREDVAIGVILLARQRVQPFTEKEIALVRTFADQAVIAIENARLFNELRARTAELGRSVEELKMLSEVGRAVSSTLDLRTVLSTVLNASLGVTWANAGAIFRYIRAERAFRLVEAIGWDEPLLRSVRDLRVAEAETAMGEAAARRMPIQIADLAKRPSAPLRDASLAAGFRSALIVPLVGPERVLGAIILMRREAGEFPSETVRLMQTLASQSVLAIQNARLFREIADKSEQLALASQHKSQFLANMSHELRTPLNAILGYAELLVDGIYGQLPDRPRGVLERIQNNGKHLLALINDVLDLAKIEAGQLALTLEDYNLPELIHSVVTATEPLATAKGLKFVTAVQNNVPLAHGDARRVSQVLLNLVGNAIKFTDAGEVEIRATADKNQFILTVHDTGPGIADADQDRIFGEFQQIDNSNTRKQGGTGLGLAISKRMVELQGGTISVDSVLGQGSTFRVVLPIHVDQVMEEAA